MHQDKIICESTSKELNQRIDLANKEGFSAIDITISSAGGGYGSEICVLLCKKTDK